MYKTEDVGFSETHTLLRQVRRARHGSRVGVRKQGEKARSCATTMALQGKRFLDDGRRLVSTLDPDAATRNDASYHPNDEEELQLLHQKVPTRSPSAGRRALKADRRGGVGCEVRVRRCPSAIGEHSTVPPPATRAGVYACASWKDGEGAPAVSHVQPGRVGGPASRHVARCRRMRAILRCLTHSW